MTADEMNGKLHMLADGVIGRAAVDALGDAVRNVDGAAAYRRVGAPVRRSARLDRGDQWRVVIVPLRQLLVARSVRLQAT